MKWVGSPIASTARREFYSSCRIDDLVISVGDCVSMYPPSEKPDASAALDIGRVVYFSHTFKGESLMHVNVLAKSSETALGDAGNPHELFLQDTCEDVPVLAAMGKVDVKKKETSQDWAKEGGTTSVAHEQGSSYFFRYARRRPDFRTFFLPSTFRKFFDYRTGSFINPPPCPAKQSDEEYDYCESCARVHVDAKNRTPEAIDELDGDETTDKYAMQPRLPSFSFHFPKIPITLH